MDIEITGGAGDERRMAIAARLGVDGDFVRVPQLARALGITPTSLHAQMRRGHFPMPHRKVGNIVVVKLDDYVRWFESNGAPARPTPHGSVARSTLKGAPIAAVEASPLRPEAAHGWRRR